MDDTLRSKYKASKTAVKNPEAWDLRAHCPRNKPHLEYFLCDDGLSSDEFIAVSSCHYWGDLFFDNPHFKTRISTESFGKVLRDRLGPSDKVKQKMVPEIKAPYQICVHVRQELSETAASLGSDWVDNLHKCVRNIYATYDSNNPDKSNGAGKKELLLFTMHKDVRNAIKDSLEREGTNHDPIHVHFASETKSEYSHSDDKHAGIADMFSMGKHCVHLLPSLETSTYFLMAANLMDSVRVFPGERWKDGCLEDSEITEMTPSSDYWWKEKDICNLKDSTCKAKDGSTTIPSLRFYKNMVDPS